MLIAETWTLQRYRSPRKTFSCPITASNRLREAMRCGLWSLSPVLGAGILTRLELYCDTGHGVGRGAVGVALTPLQIRPAWNSWSAVRLLRSTAGCPLSNTEVPRHGLFGSVVP